MDLRQIVEPLSTAQFLVEHFGVRPVHFPGSPARFANISAGELSEQLGRDLEAVVELDDSDFAVAGPIGRDILVLQMDGYAVWNIQKAVVVRLTGGDALYVPRNAVVQAEQNGSSLVFGVWNPTGAELLDVITQVIKENDLFRQDIPRFAAPGVQKDYVASLHQVIAQTLRLPALLDGYRRRLNHRATSVRGSSQARLEARADHTIELATPRLPLIERVDKDRITIRTGYVDYLYPVEMVELLQYIFDKAPVAVSQFCEELGVGLEEPELHAFLIALEVDGIIRLK